MFLQMCVTWITRIRQGTPPSCWQPLLPWKQRRTCKLWKSSSPVGMWTPKPARWVHLLADSVLAGIAVTCTSAPATLLTTEHSPCGCPVVLDDQTHPWNASLTIQWKRLPSLPCIASVWSHVHVNRGSACLWVTGSSHHLPSGHCSLTVSRSQCLPACTGPLTQVWSQLTCDHLLNFPAPYYHETDPPSQRENWLMTLESYLWSHSSQEVSCSMTATTQIRSVAQSCLTLCDPMNHSTPGLPVHHQLPEFTETHVHRVSDATQPSHPLSSPSPPAPNPSQHQSLFQWVNSSQ